MTPRASGYGAAVEKIDEACRTPDPEGYQRTLRAIGELCGTSHQNVARHLKVYHETKEARDAMPLRPKNWASVVRLSEMLEGCTDDIKADRYTAAAMSIDRSTLRRALNTLKDMEAET